MSRQAAWIVRVALAASLGTSFAEEATIVDMDAVLAHRAELRPAAAIEALGDVEGADAEALRAQLALEVELLSRLPDRVATLAPGERVARLRDLGLTPADHVTLARLCFAAGLVDAALTALGDARDGNDSLKQATDELLASHRGEPLPRGGYHRYHGAWLPAERRDRERALDGALLALVATLADDVWLGFTPRADARNHAEFERRHGAGGDVIRGACQALRAALAEDYADVRSWLPSYKSRTLRSSLLDEWDSLAAPRKALLDLIARYEKPEQPDVDRERAALERLHAKHRAAVDRDLRRLSNLAVDQAYGTYERVRRGEEALAAADRYLKRWARPGLTPPRIGADGADADISDHHVLPGRALSPLADVMWVALLHAAERDLDVMLRVDELSRQDKRLKRWERWLSRELRDRSLERYNRRVATSADRVERDFVEVVNGYRVLLGLPRFELCEPLVASARKHSQEMIDLGYFGHISPIERNRSPSDRARNEGFATGVGENCLAGGPGIRGQGAFDGWYHSPGHHRLMVSGSTQMGIGAAGGHAMWTMVAGGDDAAWRLMHQDLSPGRRRALEEAVGEVAESIDVERVESAMRLMNERVPDVIAPLARRAFGAAYARDADEQARAPGLLALLVAMDVPPSWRPIQVQAVSTAVELLQLARQTETRDAAWTLVSRWLTDPSVTYDPKTRRPDRRRAAVAAVRRHWEDEAQLAFRPSGLPEAPDEPGLVAEPPALSKTIPVFTRADRRRLAKAGGGGRETEDAVDAGLRFLASIQETDGSWRARSFPSRLKRIKGHEGKLGQGRREYEVAMTGLALLAFVVAGNTDQIGEHAEVVDRAARFLMSRVSDYGMFECGRDHYMYRHAIATHALCELYARTADPRVGVHAQMAVDYLVYAQDKDGGGWRYRAQERGDMSVTGWVVMALASAHKAELRVAGFRDAIRFLNSVTYPQYFRIGYTDRNNGATDRLGAVGTLARIFMTADTSGTITMANAWRTRRNLPARGRVDFYYWYYATLMMFQVGGEFWADWNAALVPALLETQDRDKGSPLHGSWPPQGQNSEHGGRIYQTTLGVLMLTTYYRYDRNRRPLTAVYTGDLTDAVKPQLAVLRDQSDDHVVAVASRDLIDRFGMALMPVLVRELRRDDLEDRYRRRLAELLPSCAGSDHEAVILELLDATEDEKTSVAMVRALERVCTRRSAQALIDKLDSRHRFVRGYAASALGRIGAASAVGPLQKRLEVEKDGWCRGQLNRALQRFAHKSAVSTLVEEALPNDEAGRLPILSALDALETSGVAGRIAKLKESEPDLYRRALAEIREHRETSPLWLLVRGMESRDEETRKRSIGLYRLITQRDEGYRPGDDESKRAAALERLRRFLDEQWTPPPGR